MKAEFYLTQGMGWHQTANMTKAQKVLVELLKRVSRGQSTLYGGDSTLGLLLIDAGLMTGKKHEHPERGRWVLDEIRNCVVTPSGAAALRSVLLTNVQ